MSARETTTVPTAAAWASPESSSRISTEREAADSAADHVSDLVNGGKQRGGARVGVVAAGAIGVRPHRLDDALDDR